MSAVIDVLSYSVKVVFHPIQKRMVATVQAWLTPTSLSVSNTVYKQKAYDRQIWTELKYLKKMLSYCFIYEHLQCLVLILPVTSIT